MQKTPALEQLMVCMPIGLATGVLTICALPRQRESAAVLITALKDFLNGRAGGVRASGVLGEDFCAECGTSELRG